MIYTFILIDKPQSAELRQRVRPEHKAYLAGVANSMAFAGPFTADDGVSMIGSLLAIDFPSRDAAHAWLANEPFNRSGLYASTSIHAFVNLWPQKAGFPPAA
ncbi:MAG: YciI family protein [Burkholderiaceae bacterium]